MGIKTGRPGSALAGVAVVSVVVALLLAAAVLESCQTPLQDMTPRQRYYALGSFYLEVQTLAVTNKALIPAEVRLRIVQIDAAVVKARNAVRPLLDVPDEAAEVDSQLAKLGALALELAAILPTEARGEAMAAAPPWLKPEGG